MRRRELMHTAIDRVWIGYIAEGKELLDRLRIEPAIELRAAQQRFQFRSEEQPAVREKTVIERLFAEPVARQEQRLTPLVRQGEGEHPIEAIEARLAPLLPSVNDDLRVAASAKDMSQRRQFGHQLREIVDLAVEDDADRMVFVEERLVTARKINDGQPAMPQPDPRRKIKPVAVGATMRENIGHATEQAPVGVATSAGVENPSYAAHAQPQPDVPDLS